MDIYKTSGLILIVSTVSLLLLSSPEPIGDQSAQGISIAAEQNLEPAPESGTSSRESAELLTVRQDLDRTVARDNTATTMEITEVTESRNWTLVIYPELARIFELENLDADSALREIMPMLSAKDPVIRLAALESIADMSHPQRSAMLAMALDDPLPQIRIVALEALATREDPMAWTFIEPYLYDEDAAVRVAAIEALAVMESEPSVHTLAGLMFDPEELIRNHAINAMGEIGGEQASLYLAQLRYDPDETIRRNAIEILDDLN